ncbi:MAG: relaxase/mobilization nuclease domain-containing protein [Eubacteriales bacterium]|nr:relaxase/mobilization nuclease domain-containing protein [Eubacteriales bacterium]
MAVVTYVKYKSGKNSTPSALKGVIDYCNQPYKTQVDEQIYSINGKDCNGEFAFREFMATKKLYVKSDGVMFYHYVQSFSPEENITPEEANKIGLELAKEFEGFEVLVATHIDSEHIHNHLISAPIRGRVNPQ